MADGMAKMQGSSLKQKYSALCGFDTGPSKSEEVSLTMNFIENDSDFLKDIMDAWQNRNADRLKELLTNISEGDETEDFPTFLNHVINEPINEKDQKWEGVWNVIIENKAIRKIPKKGEKPFIVLLSEQGNVQVLQLLLQHPSLKPNLRHCGPNANTPLHYLFKQTQGTQEESYRQCIKWLLDNDEVDVNALNCDFKTPLNLAEDVGNQTAIDMLSKSGKAVITNERVQLLKEAYNKNDAEIVKSIQPMSFSEMNSYLKIANNSENSQWTMGQCDYCYYILHQLVTDITEQKSLNVLLQEASRGNYGWLVRSLLDKAADPCEIDEWNDKLCAIDIANELRKIIILPSMWERDPLGSVQKVDESILSTRIDRGKIPWYMTHRGQSNVLHFASIAQCPKAMYRILYSSGIRLLGTRKPNERVPYIPAEVLETGVVTQFLDSKITTYANLPPYQERKNFLCVEDSDLDTPRTWLNLDFLVDSKEGGNNFRMDNLLGMSTIKIYDQYLMHPVIKIFLMSRWDSLKWIFFLNLAFNVILTLTLTYNILWTTITKTDILPTLRISQYLLICILIVRESAQAFVQRIGYLNPKLNFENFLEIAIIVCGLYLSSVGCNHDLYQHFGAIVVLIAWLQLMLLIGKHPLFSAQVAMFKLVFISFSKFLLFYSILIFAFSFSFFLLFKPTCSNQLFGFFGFNNTCNNTYNEFTGVGESIFRSFVMMTGELDAPNLPFENYPVISPIIFIFFVFAVVVVLLNLLNGLAVYDIQLIKQDASKYTFIENLRYLTLLDKFSAVLQNNLGCGLRTMKDTYRLDDDEIKSELYEKVNEQRKEITYEDTKFGRIPKVGNMQCEELSKKIDELEKKRSEDAELVKKILSIVEELQGKLNKREQA